MNSVQVVLSGFSVRLLCFVQAKTFHLKQNKITHITIIDKTTKKHTKIQFIIIFFLNIYRKK